MKRIIISVFTLFTLLGCEKDIDFNLNETEPVLVVDGEIESGKMPRVVLTKSFDYYKQLSVAELLNAFVHDASVTISNGQQTVPCIEYAYELFPGVSAYYYSPDTTLYYNFIGTEETTYQLNIELAGKSYTSVTKIPALVNYPDSVFFKQAPFNPDTTKRVMMVKISEEPGLGNYIRYYTKRNNEPFFPGFNSVFTDDIIDGSTFVFQLEPGVNRNDFPEPGENFFRKGDTVTLKYANITKPTFEFWNTWEFAQQSIGNPFAQPNKVLGNISNGALGAFCGYSTWYRTSIVD